MILALQIVALAATLILVGAVAIGGRRSGVVAMPSSRSVRKLVARILKEYRHVETIVDLGSGWGGLARRLARELPDCRVRAIEVSPVPHFVSHIFTAVTGPINLEHGRIDFYESTLTPSTAWVTYLSGPGMRRLRERFERDRPAGSVLVSIAFAMPGWTPTRVEHASDLFRSPVYVYEL